MIRVFILRGGVYVRRVRRERCQRMLDHAGWAWAELCAGRIESIGSDRRGRAAWPAPTPPGPALSGVRVAAVGRLRLGRGARPRRDSVPRHSALLVCEIANCGAAATCERRPSRLDTHSNTVMLHDHTALADIL